MYRQFNIQQFYVLPHTVYLCLLCGSQNKQPLFPYTTLTDWFLGTFAMLHRATTRYVMSVRPSVHTEQLRSLWTLFMICDIWVFFENFSRKVNSHYKPDHHISISHADQYTFFHHISSTLLIMIIVSNIGCTENQKTSCVQLHCLSFDNPDAVCLLRGTDWILVSYWHNHQASYHSAFSQLYSSIDWSRATVLRSVTIRDRNNAHMEVRLHQFFNFPY